MTTTCPHCDTNFRIDPAKIPENGVSARCSVCQGVFRVRVPSGDAEPVERQMPATPQAPEPPPAATPAELPEASAQAATASVFGAVDPDAKARRLARALISDIAIYHPERRDQSLQAGRLRTEFQEEIRKSWEEYVAQIGPETARRTPHFRNALNEILAQGQRVF